MALTFNVASAAQRQAAVQQARAELVVLTTAVASYRRHYGEYPQFDDATRLWSALLGRLGPTGSPSSSRPFVDPAAFRLRNGDPAAGDNAALDPWGHAYRYRWFGPASPDRDYIMYSIGPDGRDVPPTADGAIELTHADNLDNVYADRD